MQIEDEKAFWGKIRWAICRAATRYLSPECTRMLLSYVFSDLEAMIKDDFVLWQAVESALPEEAELFPTGRYSFEEMHAGDMIMIRLSSMREHMLALEKEEKPDHRSSEESPNRL